MKKLTQLLTLALTAALTLTACTSDEVVQQRTVDDSSEYISFSVSTAPTTRAVNEGQGILVYGMKEDGAALFEGDGWIQLKYDGSFTDSNNVGKYKWPTGAVTFYAIALCSNPISKSIESNGYMTLTSSFNVENMAYDGGGDCVAITRQEEHLPVVPLKFYRLNAQVNIAFKNSRPDIFDIYVEHTVGSKDFRAYLSPCIADMVVNSVKDPTYTVGLDEDGKIDIQYQYDYSSGAWWSGLDQSWATASDIIRSIEQIRSEDCAFPSPLTDSPVIVADGSYVANHIFPTKLQCDVSKLTPKYLDNAGSTLMMYEGKYIQETFIYLPKVTYQAAGGGSSIWNGALIIPLNSGTELLPNHSYTIVVDLFKGGYIPDPDNSSDTAPYVKLWDTFDDTILSFAANPADWSEDGVEVE